MSNGIPAALGVRLAAFQMLAEMREDFRVIDFSDTGDRWICATLIDGEELLFAAASLDVPGFVAVGAFESLARRLGAWACQETFH